MLLALANLLHHKIRSALSALAVGIGVAMLVTLLGLTNGSLDEITVRGQAINADFLVTPRDWNSVMAGAPFSEKHVAKALRLQIDGQPVCARVAPVYRAMMTVNKVGAEKKAKDLQTVFGIRPADWDFFCPRPPVAGQLFREPAGQERQLFDILRRTAGSESSPGTQPDAADNATIAAAQELVIDQRLATFAKLAVGDEIDAWGGRRFRIVGIVPTGVTVRVFAPVSTVRYVNESPGGATFLLVKLRDGMDPKVARDTLARELGGNVMTVKEYSGMLTELWAIIPQYTEITSAVVLTVAFLFVLVIMYTVVLQRTREIGILKSLGAGNLYIIWVVLAESMILSLVGTAVGLGMSFAGKAAIVRLKPLLTVDMNWHYILAGVLTGLIGGILSGLYPAWVAVRQDPVTALGYE
ncbi:MAG: ABC transporter permease [Phycisphaerae bacterium]|nr:ABC transporter permease [Phycisphaerae bacterium]